MKFFDLSFLIADDSDFTINLIHSNLKKMGGFYIDSVKDGEACVHRLTQNAKQQNPYHFLLLDWEMPKMNGLEVLKAVRNNHFIKNTIVVMITAVNTEDEVKLISNFHPDGYLIKPFTPELFSERIMKLCKKHLNVTA